MAQSDPIPSVPELGALEALGFRPRRGQLTMIAGQPGALKSTFALWWALKTGLPTLYISADMDAHDAISRLTAAVTGHTVKTISEALEHGAEDLYEDSLSEVRIQFAFDSAPTMFDVADEIAAYVEVNNGYPSLIIVDNLMNLESDASEDFSGLKHIVKELHRLARETKAAVFVLHHMREEGSPARIQPRNNISGKVAQLPEGILGIAYDQSDGRFFYYPLKCRGGKADPSGNSSLILRARPERATFETYYEAYGGYAWS